jgi:hypothetical protein
LPSQKWVEDLALEALLVPARHGRAREIVQADDIRVVDLPGDAGREGALL